MRKCLITCVVASAGAAVVLGDVFDLSWNTIDDGGGIMFSSGGNLELSASIGQPDASPVAMIGGSFELTGGFWFALAPGDCNTDGGVNLFDYGDLEPCLSGPDGGLTGSTCECFDRDGDEDIDLADVAEFQGAFTAP